MNCDVKKSWEPPTLQAIDMRETAQKGGQNEGNQCGVAPVNTGSCPPVS